MNLPSSSTSSSEPRPGGWRRGLALAGWVVLWLVVIDVAVGRLFAYPADPKNTNPGAVALYFDYGRSMEGRLRRATRADPAASAPITQAGWYDPLVASEGAAKPGGVRVTFYGMSHAMRLADALQEVSPRYQARSIGAPGATTNWSFGAFRRDRERGQSQAAVLAIMSSTLPMIVSPAPMAWNTSFALPYTADRYSLNAGRLQVAAPPYDSFAGYVRTLEDPAAWERANAWFAANDPFYDRFLVRQTWLDESVAFRLIRRAWAQRRDVGWRGRVLDAQGYDPDSEAVRLANAIVAEFARQARADGLVPVIYVVDSFGFGDQLHRALAGTLRRERIAYLATSRFVNPADPAGYLPDSHFTDANDRRLAAELAAVLDRELAAAAPPPAGE
ncbi:MAG: hypothetical protein B7Z08_00280 [Sphingomonadales bacterium 32-68-7]|nr:MAG: hypothetical protein B7Z33_09295 [Sphingomonadales bacterium 12-68-11]OYX10567.1 MAG: hypothetical protein B7Z08_00280 [Sphingomonadales bacterium 32-68-7]